MASHVVPVPIFPGLPVVKMVGVRIFPGYQVVKIVRVPKFPSSGGQNGSGSSISKSKHIPKVWFSSISRSPELQNGLFSNI